MTGKLGAALVAFVCVLAAVPSAQAQVQVSASLDIDRVPVGHSARFTVTVVGADREIVPPSLPDLPAVNTFSAGQSQRFSFVNGQYTTLDASVSYAVSEKVMLELVGTNITDTNYEPADGYQAPGLEVLAGLRVTF